MREEHWFDSKPAKDVPIEHLIELEDYDTPPEMQIDVNSSRSPFRDSRAQVPMTEEEAIGFAERFMGDDEYIDIYFDREKAFTFVTPVGNVEVDGNIHRLLIESDEGFHILSFEQVDEGIWGWVMQGPMEKDGRFAELIIDLDDWPDPVRVE